MKHQSKTWLLVATSAIGLCGYSISNGLINWQYYGTPIAGQYYLASNGKPTISEYSRDLPAGLPALPTDLASRIAYTLPEAMLST